MLLEASAQCHICLRTTEMVHVCLEEGRRHFFLLRREGRLNFSFLQ